MTDDRDVRDDNFYSNKCHAEIVDRFRTKLVIRQCKKSIWPESESKYCRVHEKLKREGVKVVDFKPGKNKVDDGREYDMKEMEDSIVEQTIERTRYVENLQKEIKRLKQSHNPQKSEITTSIDAEEVERIRTEERAKNVIEMRKAKQVQQQLEEQIEEKEKVIQEQEENIQDLKQKLNSLEGEKREETKARKYLETEYDELHKKYEEIYELLAEVRQNILAQKDEEEAQHTQQEEQETEFDKVADQLNGLFAQMSRDIKDLKDQQQERRPRTKTKKKR